MGFIRTDVQSQCTPAYAGGVLPKAERIPPSTAIIMTRESKRTRACACAHCWLQIVELRRARAHQLRGIEQVGRIPLRRVFGHDVDRGSGQMVAEQGNNFCRLPALAGLVDLLVLAVGAAKDVGEPGLHAVIDVTLAALSSPIPAPLQQRIGAAE